MYEEWRWGGMREKGSVMRGENKSGWSAMADIEERLRHGRSPGHLVQTVPNGQVPMTCNSPLRCHQIGPARSDLPVATNTQMSEVPSRLSSEHYPPYLCGFVQSRRFTPDSETAQRPARDRRESMDITLLLAPVADSVATRRPPLCCHCYFLALSVSRQTIRRVCLSWRSSNVRPRPVVCHGVINTLSGSECRESLPLQRLSLRCRSRKAGLRLWSP
ncbi:hypothetical protein BD413DRAFT_298468 [Trametes elegans]|nr:hypothetical protein BD413DRAFT_298468 [Trametes elegans]